MAPLLVWQAPAECPDLAAVQARLDQVLARQPRPLDSAAEVHGRATPDPAGGWQLDLELRPSSTRAASPAQRRRHLTAPHCDELADAAAVAIALALGDATLAATPETATNAAAAATPPQSPPSATPADAHASEALDLAPLEARAPREHRLGLGLDLAAVVDSGLASGAAAGGALGLQARFDAWGAALYGVWLPEHARVVAADAGVGFGVLGAGLRGCYRGLDASVALDACLGLEIDSLHAAPYGLRASARSRTTLWAPLVGAGISVGVLPGWALVSRLDGLWATPRQRYVVNVSEAEWEQVHRTPPFVARFSIGLEGDLLGR